MRTFFLAAVLACSPLAGLAQSLFLDNVPGIALTSAVGQSAVSIDPATGNVTVRSSAGNLNECSSTAPPSPQITSFFASPNPVQTSGSFSVSWTSTNTTSCTPSQGTAAWAAQGTLGTSGTVNGLVAPASAQNVNFRLTCTNGSTSVFQDFVLQVQSGGGGGSCTAQWSPNIVGWSGVFQTAFPSHPGGAARVSVSSGTTISAQFVASSPGAQFGTISSAGFPGDGEGMGLLSISTSAGCFNQAQLGSNCLSELKSYPVISWRIGASSTQCQLTQGATYFLNFTFGSATSPGSGPYCVTGNCARDLFSIAQQRQAEED